MFEFFPILNGSYLTYGEYFALIISLVTFLLSAITYLIGKWLYSSSKIKKKLKVDYMVKSFKIRGYNDVLRAMGVCFTIISAFFMCIAVTSWTAFNIIPMWITVILNKIVLTSLFAHILVKLDHKKMKKFTFRRGLKKIKAIKDTRLRNFILLLIIGISMGLPMIFGNTCICLYEQNYEEAFNLEKLGVPASFNTKLSRLLQVNQACEIEDGPCHVYATLPEQTDQEVYITVHTHENVKKPLTMSYYNNLHRQSTTSTVFHFNDLESRGQRRLHTFHLTNLIQNELYNLTLTIQKKQYSFQYRSLKSQYSESSPLNLVSGGDVGNSRNALMIWNQIATKNPDVVLIGGDLAYDNNILGCYWTWDLFLDQVDLLNNKVGRLVPIILAVGNHDYGLNPNPKRQLVLNENQVTPMFITYFPQHKGKSGVPNIRERKPYFVQKLGQNVLFTLDSGYQYSFGEQAQFMDTYLFNNPNTHLKFAQYHHPIYSSCVLKSYESFNFEEGNLLWIPLFDKYNFATVYENHQHTLKRTKLIKSNIENEKGTLYLGDGSWGANVADCQRNSHSYLQTMLYDSSVWISTIGDSTLNHIAITTNGSIVDQFLQELKQ